MRRLLLVLTLFFSAAIAVGAPAAGNDPALTRETRAALVALRAEEKFLPDVRSGYVGVDVPEDSPPLNAAVNGLIDQVLARADGALREDDILPLIGLAVGEVDLFATEDRDRAYR